MALQNTPESGEGWCEVWLETSTLSNGPKYDERRLVIESLWKRLGVMRRANPANNMNMNNGPEKAKAAYTKSQSARHLGLDLYDHELKPR